MKTPLITLGILLISINLLGCANNQQTGTLVGGVTGGVIGSQFGSGSGRVLATGAGAVVGGLIGNEVGRSMDERDRYYSRDYYRGY